MWSVPGPSGQPYIMLKPHLDFYACCPTLLAFGYPVSLLIFFLIFFSTASYHLVVNITSAYQIVYVLTVCMGNSWADVQASDAGCGGGRSTFAQAASIQAYAITRT